MAVFALGLWPAAARAWIYSEHRQITARGIETLDPQRRAELDRLWELAREGHEARLCGAADAGDQGGRPACIDLASWPSVNGDHSCSPDEMLRVILDSDWILSVARIAAKAGAGIASARNESERRNAQMNGDLRLERADLDYSTRAGSNNAHHLLPRSGTDLRQYIADVVRAGVEPNVIGLFVMFHSAALERAASAPTASASPAERAAEMRQILALECFALHFLEDAFAAGHVAGSWGPTAERKGTHDYYNEHGIEADTWDNEPVTLFGDAHMRPPDLERAGEAVRLSFDQLLEAFVPDSVVRCDAVTLQLPGDVASGAFDACKATAMPGWAAPATIVDDLMEVVRGTPIPFRGQGYASLPRFRAEIGPFVGIASGVIAEGADGGFSASREGGLVGSLDLGLRLGYGIDALLGDSGDGLVFVQGGILLQSRSTGGCGTDCPSDPILSQFVPGLPARSALNFRLRVPFWLIPGDLLLAAPILAFANPQPAREDGDRVRRRGTDSVADETVDADRVSAVRGGTRDVRQPVRIPGRRRRLPRGVRALAGRFPDLSSPSPSGRSSGTFRSSSCARCASTGPATAFPLWCSSAPGSTRRSTRSRSSRGSPSRRSRPATSRSCGSSSTAAGTSRPYAFW